MAPRSRELLKDDLENKQAMLGFVQQKIRDLEILARFEIVLLLAEGFEHVPLILDPLPLLAGEHAVLDLPDQAWVEASIGIVRVAQRGIAELQLHLRRRV